MRETRVSKYKDYRNSLIKDGSVSFETPSQNQDYINRTTTSTLPMDEVLKTLETPQEEVVFSKNRRKQKVLLIGGLSLLGVLLITGIIIFAVIAF